MGDVVIPRFFVRTVLVVTTWLAGAAFAAHVPDEAAQRRAEELAPLASPPTDAPIAPQNPAPSHPGSHSGRPAEAPPLVDPPSPAPA